MVEKPPVITDVRPWGNFKQFCHNEQVTVKIITVSPGQKLSVQRHQHRDELWIILDKNLLATISGGSVTSVPGREIWIPRGEIHTIENCGNLPGRFLEVAFGEFDEQDIERLEDKYNRV